MKRTMKTALQLLFQGFNPTKHLTNDDELRRMEKLKNFNCTMRRRMKIIYFSPKSKILWQVNLQSFSSSSFSSPKDFFSLFSSFPLVWSLTNLSQSFLILNFDFFHFLEIIWSTKSSLKMEILHFLDFSMMKH